MASVASSSEPAICRSNRPSSFALEPLRHDRPCLDRALDRRERRAHSGELNPDDGHGREGPARRVRLGRWRVRLEVHGGPASRRARRRSRDERCGAHRYDRGVATPSRIRPLRDAAWALRPRRDRRRARLRRGVARACGRPRRHGRSYYRGDAARPGERRPGSKTSTSLHRRVEAERCSHRALYGAPADHRQRELHRERPGRNRIMGARREARRGSRLLLALQPLDRDDDARHRSVRRSNGNGEGADRGAGWPDERHVGRVSAYFRAEPVGGRTGTADRAASAGPTVFFCLTDRRPRPHWGPCIWPGQVR